MAIDWEAIAKQVGDIRSKAETYSTLTGRRALEVIVGEDNVRDAVDYWISQEPGCFTAEMVLSILRSKVAMDRCYEIYKTQSDTETAIRAVFLLTRFADDGTLPWVQEFLDDRNSSIRWNGLMVLRTIIDGPLGDAAIASATRLLDKADQDPDPRVRERTQVIRSEMRAKHPYVGTRKPYSELPHTSLTQFHSIEAVKKWREREHDAGRRCSLEDFYNAHGLCFACRATGVAVTPVGFDGETPLFVPCQICGGTAKLIVR